MRLRKSNEKKKKNLLIAVGVLVAVVIIFFAVRLLMPEAAVNLYLKAEKNSFEKTARWVEKSYTEFNKKQTPYLEEPYRRRVELTSDIGSGVGAFGSVDIGEVSDLIGKSKLVVDIKKQPREDNSLTNVSLLLEKVPFLDAELFKEHQELFFSVPVLLPGKYFSVDMNQLEEVYDKFSVPIQPKKLVTGAEIASALEFDATVFKTSTGKLGSTAANYFTKDTVRYGQQKELQISGKTITGTEVLVSLEEESATAMLYELADMIAQDDALLQYTYGNFADLSVLLEDAGLFRLFEYMDETGAAAMNEVEKGLLDSLKVEKDVDGFRKALKESIGKYIVKDGLQMTLVIDKDGNILERKLVLDMQDTKGADGFVLDFASGCSNMVFEDARNRYVDLVMTQYGDAGKALGKSTAEDAGETGNTYTADGSGSALRVTEVHIRPEFERAKENETSGSVGIEYATTPHNGGQTGIHMNVQLSSKMDELTLRANKIVGFLAKIFGDTGEGTLEGEWIQEAWENNKLSSRNDVSKISVKADLPFLGVNDFSGVLNLTREDRFGIEPFNLPEVSRSSVVDLNAATQQDLDKIEMEIMASFGAFYLNNKPIFDAILGQ